jgi:muramoyltetrapeptide carboxypeptidase
MMWQLFRAGKLDHLAGLVVGGFTDAKDDKENPFGKNEYEIIWEKVSLYRYPVCFGFPVGHQAKNMALKFGVEHELRIEEDRIVLQEILPTE